MAPGKTYAPPKSSARKGGKKSAKSRVNFKPPIKGSMVWRILVKKSARRARNLQSEMNALKIFLKSADPQRHRKEIADAQRELVNAENALKLAAEEMKELGLSENEIKELLERPRKSAK